jgi:hypothetical protein
MGRIDRELHDYVTILSEEQKKTVLNVVKALASDTGNRDDWEDEDFVAGIDKECDRYHSIASGSATVHYQQGIRN